MAWRIGGGSYQSASDPRLHFGLGDATRVDSVEVRWPSGRVDRFTGLSANAGYLIRENKDAPVILEGFSPPSSRPRHKPRDVGRPPPWGARPMLGADPPSSVPESLPSLPRS